MPVPLEIVDVKEEKLVLLDFGHTEIFGGNLEYKKIYNKLRETAMDYPKELDKIC